MNRSTFVYRVRRRDRTGRVWKAAAYYSRQSAAERRAARWRALGYTVAIDRSAVRVLWRGLDAPTEGAQR